MVSRAQDEVSRMFANVVGERGAGIADPVAEVVVDPHAPQAIAQWALDERVAVVMASSGRTLLHPGYIGSAAEYVVRHAANPVLILGPCNHTRLADVSRVVAACDGSPVSEQVLPDAARLSDELGVALWIVTALGLEQPLLTGSSEQESNYVRRLATGLAAEWDVLHGANPAQSIVDWEPSAMIAMTTHGHGGFRRLRLGSVTAAVIRHATGPLLIRRADQED